MSKGPHCYDPVSQRLYHSLDITLLEDVPFFAGTPPVPSSDAAPLKVYARRALPLTPLPDFFSVSGTSPSHLVPTFVSPRYPS